MKKRSIYKDYMKRLLDILTALLALIILAPVYFVIAAVIKMNDGGAILFKQERMGMNQRPFFIYKFRSMIVNADQGGKWTKIGDTRITKVGAFLRKTSLDELPQLLNVLKGEMSVIGPRPDIKELMMNDKPAYFERFEVRPGITGLAQVRGRSNITAQFRVDSDAEYVRNISIYMDVRIIIWTIFCIFKRTGTN